MKCTYQFPQWLFFCADFEPCECDRKQEDALGTGEHAASRSEGSQAR